MNDKIPMLKISKQKICKERDVGKLRVISSDFCQELTILKFELEILTKQLEDTKSQLSQARHQMAMIEICTRSERSKIGNHVEHLNAHKEGFNKMFNKERAQSEVREKELREKEAEEMESERQRRKIAAARNEQRAREAAALDAESDAVEQACVVLKKRNNAIMLKLRRKLVETEDIRRELMKLKEQTSSNHNF